MHTYLGIHCKRNVILNDLFKEKIERTAATILGVEQSKAIWESANKDILIAYWTNEPTENFVYDTTAAFALSGYASSPVSEVFHKLQSSSNAEKNNNLFSNLNGLFTGVFANSNGNYMQGWNTITRVEPLYWAENEKYFFISNRALLLHLVESDRNTPDYEIKNLVPFIHNGYHNSDLTPYRNVNVLAPNSTVISTPDKTITKVIDDINSNSFVFNQPSDELYDQITREFINGFKVILDQGLAINAAITGGKDSRLSVAALSYLNANFKTYTHGYDEHPDVIVGKRIANELGLEHYVTRPSAEADKSDVVVQDILKRATNILSLTDGMLTAYENVTGSYTFNPEKVILGGHGGEHLRGGYNRIVTRHDHKGLETLLFEKLNPYKKFMNKEFQNYYEQDLNEWLEMSNQIPPEDIMTRYFVTYRTGRWSSAARTGFNYNYYLYQPFFDSRLNKILSKVPSKFLLNDEVIYNILLRIAPSLVDVPFYADRWKFESNGPISGSEKQWEKRAPITAKQQSKGSFNWRRATLTDMKDAMMEEIFSSTNDRLFHIVDKNEVELVFSSDRYINKPEIDILVWNLYTVSLLLSNKWIGENDLSRKVEINLPATKIVSKRNINFIDFNMQTSNKEISMKVKKNKLLIRYKNNFGENNLYIQTIGGKFTEPPKNKYEELTSLGNFKEYKVIFDATSRNEKQKIVLFFMCYDKEKRIYNKSIPFVFSTKSKQYTCQFKPPKEAANFKIAIKVIPINGSKGEIKLENMSIYSLV
ncbi:asparagine synthase-related protein [Salirhabdus sp. Marseille-P4669]|uniref:asparagine synthase-related protein n=1 Tax=Salirhabdus sp. Marseille-P4669 TaxID=2042310 RepID=UPI000C7D0B36|nr:asparagine synthase-related protein [Salirhabdus sp. Marseille-P4669]